ncbi:hypothetical protein Btru_050594 [Bulinus truncatus]|nr:hypothetical protein Btru_050594 [Bulinus truncatus]
MDTKAESSAVNDVKGDKPVNSAEINGHVGTGGSNALASSKTNSSTAHNNSSHKSGAAEVHGHGSNGRLTAPSLDLDLKSLETRPLLLSSSTTPATSPTAVSPTSPTASTATTSFAAVSSDPTSPDSSLSDVEKFKQKISTMTSSNSLGNSRSSSHPEFHSLKSAMKHSGEDGKKGKRKLSLFNTVMRRVSIHRKESTPSGRIATFFFGTAEDAMKEDSEEDDVKDNGDSDVESKHQGDNHGDHHGHHSAKSVEERKHHQAAVLKENLFLILSGLYGVVIVILGAVLPITEIFVKNEKERSFEAFYLYLYIVSIIFLIYVYAYLLRRNRLKTEFLTRTLSRSLSWTRNWAKSWAKADEATKGKLRKRMTSLDVDNHHTGTFYLRLGVLGFGIGSMIHSGLNFGKFFAVAEEVCQEALDAVKPLFHLVFTFFQLYFIFMNSKMCIHRYKKLARFGLMHMCATNICVWFQSIVVETLHVIHMHAHSSGHHEGGGDHGGASHGSADAHSDASGHGDDHHGPTSAPYKILSTTVKIGRRLHAASSSHDGDSNGSAACELSGMMNDAVEAAGPYLYPCTIEYSLMCAGILYVMWKNVGNKPRKLRQSEIEEEDDQRVHRMSVDCTSSSRGLFLGILMMVGTIISIIAFYMLVNTEDMQMSAILMTHLSETFIYAVTLLAIILAAWKMKGMTFHSDHEIDLEDILVLISYTGLLVFIIFSLVASILHPSGGAQAGLTILSNIFMLIQSTAQTIFMLAGDRMTASNEVQQRKKAGREFITFLLISNFAMWAVNTFETQTPQHNPIQVEFYGNDAWAIFTHVSVPLGIYYRFHSTVCFSNIWKNAWKIRKHDHGHG